VTLIADEVYAAVEPIADLDAGSGYPLRALNRAIGSMFAQPEEAIRALGDGKDSWERLWNPALAPLWLLPFIGQGVGVVVDTSLSKEEQVAQIEEEAPWKRGRPAAIIKAVQSTLYSAFNLVPNPNLEVNTAKWGVGAGWLTAGATLTRVTTQHQQGEAALQIVCPATINTGGAAELPGTFLKGIAYTGSLYVKGNAGGETMVLGLGTATDDNQTPVTLTTSWQRVTVTWTPTADRTGCLLALWHSAASAVTVFADAAQVEVGKTATAYYDGNSAGYAWLGQPNESTSVNTSTPGSKRVRLIERNSNAWTLLVVTYPSETPDPTATKNAALSATPGGIVVTVEQSELPLIDEGTRLISAATEATIDTATLAQVT
jgi:hypothetical protein